MEELSGRRVNGDTCIDELRMPRLLPLLLKDENGDLAKAAAARGEAVRLLLAAGAAAAIWVGEDDAEAPLRLPIDLDPLSPSSLCPPPAFIGVEMRRCQDWKRSRASLTHALPLPDNSPLSPEEEPLRGCALCFICSPVCDTSSDVALSQYRCCRSKMPNR